MTRNSDAEPLRRNRYAVTIDVARNKLSRLEVILAQRHRRRLLDRARSSPDEPAGRAESVEPRHHEACKLAGIARAGDGTAATVRRAAPSLSAFRFRAERRFGEMMEEQPKGRGRERGRASSK